MRISLTNPVAATFPDGASTGYTSGDLDPDPGGGGGIVTLATPGQVYSGRLLTGFIVVEAPDVEITDCLIDSQGARGIRLMGGASAWIHDVEVVGLPDGESCIDLRLGAEALVERVNCHNAENGIQMGNNARLYGSYVHNLASSNPSAHHDGVEHADGKLGWEIVGNTILNNHPETAAVWIGDALHPELPSEGLLQGNLLAGGGYTVYAGASTGEGLRVVNNMFSTQFFPDAGSFGPVTGWQSAGNVWINNRWYDGPLAGQLITP